MRLIYPETRAIIYEHTVMAVSARFNVVLWFDVLCFAWSV